jgi:hypothetical protein
VVKSAAAAGAHAVHPPLVIVVLILAVAVLSKAADEVRPFPSQIK